MKYLILLSFLLLAACNSTNSLPTGSEFTDVMRLIEQSEMTAPKGVKGTFYLAIKASGIERQFVYLNTELDYRDRRNISVAIHPKAHAAFINKYGASPDVYFINKNIEVTGEAKRVKILFVTDGRRTEKYYFQTHIRVSSIAQIKVLS